MKDQRNHLDPEQRAAVIRETFEAITAVGFMKWKAEELMGFGYEVSEDDRQDYFREFEKQYFPDFQKLTANASDDRLLDAMEFWIDKANTMGLKEWQEVLSEGQGAQPWYEALEKEVAADAKLQFRPGEPVQRPDSFDRAVARLRRQWRDDGFEQVSGAWSEQPPEIKVGYLASFAAVHDVPFERFVKAAKHVLGAEEFNGDDYWHLRRQFREARRDQGLPLDQETAGRQSHVTACRSSVLGYKLPEPSPAQEQSKDRSHGR